ncbi:hypothetical protein CVN76_09545 [Bacillus sp. mrc49]|nr:hypothetical protein CVN76_09545 [Bacillus sp. mrc49]
MVKGGKTFRLKCADSNPRAYSYVSGENFAKLKGGIEMEYSPEQLMKHFGDPAGFSRMSNTLVRLYTLLDGFDVTTAGLYAYLRSWRNTTNEDMRGIVWHSREYLQAQSGLGRKAFDSRLRVLKECGLVAVIKSPVVANKDYFVVHDPLTRDEFIAKYPSEIKAFFTKVEEIQARIAEDREKRKKFFDDALAEEVSRSHEIRATLSDCTKGTDGSESKTDIPM